MRAAASRSCACEDNKTGGGCQLAIDICAGAYTDGLAFDFACGDEVYGGCTQLREFFGSSGQAYVLRVASNVAVTLATGAKLTCAEAVRWLVVKDRRRWEVRSAAKGSKGGRWYAWAWIATASSRHHLLVTAALLRDRTDSQGPPGVRTRF